MTSIDHPTIEQLSDLQEDLLGAQEAAEVRAHAAECELCRDTLAALSDVRGLLGETGAEQLSIPEEVATSLQASIARVSAERDAGVSSLDEHRTAATSSPGAPAARKARPRKLPRWVLGAGAAAAAVVAFAVVGSILDDSSDDSAGGSAADSGDVEAQRPDAGGLASDEPPPGPTESYAEGGAREVPKDIQRVAEALAAASASEFTAPQGACRIAAQSLSDDLRITQLPAHGGPALLVVDTSSGSFRVLDCDTGLPIYRGTL